MEYVFVVSASLLQEIAAGDTWGAKEVALSVFLYGEWFPLEGENKVVILFDIFFCELYQRSAYLWEGKHVDLQNIIGIEVIVNIVFVKNVVVGVTNIYFNIYSLIN